MYYERPKGTYDVMFMEIVVNDENHFEIQLINLIQQSDDDPLWYYCLLVQNLDEVFQVIGFGKDVLLYGQHDPGFFSSRLLSCRLEYIIYYAPPASLEDLRQWITNPSSETL